VQLGTVTYSDTDPWFVVLQLWGRFDDGAASWTWTHASRSTQAYCTAYIGVHATTPIDVAATTAFKNGGGTNQPIAPSQTIVTAGARGIICRGSWDGNAITPPAGWSERLDVPVLWVGDRDWAAPGATGTVSVASGNGSALAAWGVIMAALRPAGTAPNQATATGAINWGPATVIGKRTPKSTAVGGISWGPGSAVAARVSRATAAGSIMWGPGTAVSRTVRKASAVGGFHYGGGSAVAARQSLAEAAGAIIWGPGVAVASQGHTAVATGLIEWGPGVAVARADHMTLAVGAITWGPGVAVAQHPADGDRDIHIVALGLPTVAVTVSGPVGNPITVGPATAALSAGLAELPIIVGSPADDQLPECGAPTVAVAVLPPTAAVTYTPPTR
jgi:hypothetical protein